jgi:ribosomal protein S18 acetylase RimI-like enzyme
VDQRVADSIFIRQVEKFPEPEFSRLQRIAFAEMQQESPELAAALAQEAAAKPSVEHVHSPIFRLGAYDGEALVGWSYGWMERGNVFYMANSGVVPSHRRRGLYSSLLAAIREHAVAQGAVALRSQHSVMNNAVLIAKLRAGFHVCGLSQHARMGALVELMLHFFEGREALFRTRSLPYATPDA